MVCERLLTNGQVVVRAGWLLPLKFGPTAPNLVMRQIAGAAVLEDMRCPEKTLPDRTSGMGAASPMAVAAALVCCVFLLRLPSLFLRHELNPDESQMLAQGMKFLVDPVPWRAVDPTTSGPINSWLISVLLLAGFKPGYVLAHILATTLITFQVLTAYRTLLHLTTRALSAIAVLPMVLFYGLASEANFLHYSSELLPALVLALGFLCFVKWLQLGPSPSFRTTLVFLSGFAFGFAPWCKLQAAPIAGVVGLVVLAAMAIREPGPRRRLRNIVVFLAGTLLPAGIILGAVVHSGVARDFWISYVSGNFAHAGQTTLTALLLRCATVLLLSAQTLPLFLIDILAAAFFVHRIRWEGGGKFTERELWILGSIVLYLCASLFAVSRPITNFDHYQVFLVQPMTYLAAVLVDRDLRPSLSRLVRPGLGAGFALVIALIVVSVWAMNGVRYAHYATKTYETTHPRQDSNERIAAVVRNIAKTRPASSLAIWGWAPGVYVLTGIPPATRDADMSVVITRGPLQGYYRQRFLSDFRRTMPDLFIDAVASGTYMWNPGYNDWTENDGYESYGEVRRFVDANYVLVGKLRLRPGGKPVRFFARSARTRLISPNSKEMFSVHNPVDEIFR
jgi:hypothetical protein